MSFQSRAKRVVAVVLAVYALLVATHRGEFWPFSIYPMFSQAGNPWTRALVREIPASATGSSHLRTALLTPTVGVDELPGKPLPLKRLNVNQNDVANFVSKTAEWSDREVSNLRHLLAEAIGPDRAVLVYRVRGTPGSNGRVEVRCIPLFLFTPDASHPSPHVGSRLHAAQ